MKQNCEEEMQDLLSSHANATVYEVNGTKFFFTFNFTEEQWKKILEELTNRNVSASVEVVLIVMYAFLIIGGLISNVLISFVVARRKQMHTARNLYIVNLTVSDISLCLICMPFTLIMILRRNWTLGPMLCKLVSLLQGTNVMVSVGTITVIALDRYFTICHKNSQKLMGTRRKVLLSIFLIWLISVLVTSPIFFYQVVEPVIIEQCVIYEACIEKWPSQAYRVSYAAAVLLIMAVIPPLVVGIVHAKIAKYLNNHARTQKDSRRAQKELDRNKKTTVLLSVIAIIFVVSWLPLGGFSLIADLESTPDMFQSSPQQIYIGFAIVHVIAMSSAISNPIVYGWLNTNIRQELLQLMPSRCSRVCAKHPQRNWMTGGATTVDETTRTHVHYEDVKINREAINLLVSVENNVHNVDLQDFARLEERSGGNSRAGVAEIPSVMDVIDTKNVQNVLQTTGRISHQLVRRESHGFSTVTSVFQPERTSRIDCRWDSASAFTLLNHSDRFPLDCLSKPISIHVFGRASARVQPTGALISRSGEALARPEAPL